LLNKLLARLLTNKRLFCVQFLGRSSNRDFAKEVWLEITSDIEVTNTELKKFIRYFWISRRGLVTEKKIYREIKNRITDWMGLLNELWDDATCYNQLLEGSENDFSTLKHAHRIYDAVSALRLMQVSQCYILLLSILRNYAKLGTDPTRIFELIERFTFQYSVVCKQPSNKVEKIYSRFALKLEEAVHNTPEKKLPAKVQSIFSELEYELGAEAPSETLFKESFRELSYKNSEQGRRLIKYILARIDSHFRQTDEHRIDFGNVNIEHILPQTPSKEWKLSKKEIKNYVNLLGNLTLVSKVINSKVQNGPLDQKLPELAKSELPINQQLVQRLGELGHWGKNDIIERQDLLADLAYKHIWNL
jgi:hypothetical protein